MRIWGIVIVLIATSLFATYINEHDVLAVCENHIALFDKSNHSICDISKIYEDGCQVGYIANLNPKGYIVLPCDKRIRPVIAYSFESNILEAPFESKMLEILRIDLKHRTNGFANHDLSEYHHNMDLWDLYTGEATFLIASFRPIREHGPWLETNWGQRDPYDTYCPIDPEDGGTCPTGCTMTATTMIMNYWEYPYSIQLTEDDSYYSAGTYPTIYIDGPERSLDSVYYNRANIAGPSNDMIARMMAAVGCDLRANYSSTGTGASVYAYDFKTKWHFLTAKDFHYTFDEAEMIVNAIGGKPMFMAMYSATSGHAVVIDGWETSGSFHVNLGWDGHENGWYYILEEGGLPAAYVDLGWITLNIIAPPHADFPSNPDSALWLNITNQKQRKTNAINPLDDEDWYEFRAVSDSTYLLYTTGPNNTIIEIFTSDLSETLMICEDGGDFRNFSVAFSPEDGASPANYFAKITATSSYNENNYKLYYLKYESPEPPGLELLIPYNGQVLEGNTIIDIIFRKFGEPMIENVNLQYSLSGEDGPWNMIAENITGNRYLWNIPDVVANHENCYIRVFDPETGIRDANEVACWILQFDVDEEASMTPSELDFIAYPNPFNSAVAVDLKGESGSIEIYNTLGESVFTSEEVDSRFTWTIDKSDKSITSGVYTINVIIGEKVLSRRVLYIQ